MPKGNPNPSPETRFQPGHQAPTKFGGEGALVRLRTGQPFIGIALEVLEGVLTEMAVNLDTLPPLDAILVKRAAKFEATARLFDSAALGAAEAGDLDRWEKYQQRAGWIGSKSFSALTEVKKMLADRDAGTVAIARIIEATEEDSDGDGSGPG